MNKIKTLIIGVCTLALLCTPLSIYAQSAPNLGFGKDSLAGRIAGQSGYDVAGTSATSFSSILGTIIQLLLSFLAIVFTILILVAGFNWMMARGDESRVKSAQDTIRTAVIGLIIVLGAYSITAFVLSAISRVGGNQQTTTQTVPSNNQSGGELTPEDDPSGPITDLDYEFIES